MLEPLIPIAEATRISVAPEHRATIAIVGAGAIVDYAHLPAYKQLGLEIAGIYDVDADKAKDVAARHGVRHVYATLENLLGDGDVALVDIAVVPWAQPAIVRDALTAGKHLMCQKPLALEVDTARGLVNLAEEANRQVAVNQQLRFDEGLAAARAMVQAGWIGEVTTMSFTVNIETDWSAWPWMVNSDRLEVMYHSIHYLDAIRSILGDPVHVFCSGTRTHGQQPKGETRTISTLVFDGDVRALVHVTHENHTRDPEALFRIDGSGGAIKGTLGLLYDYPHGRPDTVEVFSSTLPTDGWLPYPVTGRWLPDAFAGPMASLLTAIGTGGQPATAARDNVRTVELVHALYRSMETGQAVQVEYS
jgi:predicted dehydrogenase